MLPRNCANQTIAEGLVRLPVHTIFRFVSELDVETLHDHDECREQVQVQDDSEGHIPDGVRRRPAPESS
jgi:hypothetical protein